MLPRFLLLYASSGARTRGPLRGGHRKAREPSCRQPAKGESREAGGPGGDAVLPLSGRRHLQVILRCPVSLYRFLTSCIVLAAAHVGDCSNLTSVDGLVEFYVCRIGGHLEVIWRCPPSRLDLLLQWLLQYAFVIGPSKYRSNCGCVVLVDLQSIVGPSYAYVYRRSVNIVNGTSVVNLSMYSIVHVSRHV